MESVFINARMLRVWTLCERLPDCGNHPNPADLVGVLSIDAVYQIPSIRVGFTDRIEFFSELFKLSRLLIQLTESIISIGHG